MARDLKKFVNPRFLKTCDLNLLQRLLKRHEADLVDFDPAVLAGPEAPAREALQSFFADSEDRYPPGLVADLHRIADLATNQGMRIILERARALGTAIIPPAEVEADEEEERIDARHLAIRTFLDHPSVFEAAADFWVLESKVALTEFSGVSEGVEPVLTDEARHAFETAAKALFAADLMGRYCRVGWYEDGGEINLVVTYGAQITSTPIVKDNAEAVISFRPAVHAVLSYRPEDGRLKLGGVDKAQRSALATIFAGTMLGRTDFFAGHDCQNLYTLEPVERAGFGFQIHHAHDPHIRSARIIEVDAQWVTPTPTPGRSGWQWAVVVKDRLNALARLGEIAPRMTFGPEAYRLSHIVLRVEIDAGATRPARMTVKIKPPGTAMFKRERFEGCIMELLRRNGFCLDRDTVEAAAAA